MMLCCLMLCCYAAMLLCGYAAMLLCCYAAMLLDGAMLLCCKIDGKWTKNKGFGGSQGLPGASGRHLGSKRVPRGKKGLQKPFRGTPLAASWRPSRAPSWTQVGTMWAKIALKVVQNGILKKGRSQEGFFMPTYRSLGPRWRPKMEENDWRVIKNQSSHIHAF